MTSLVGCVVCSIRTNTYVFVTESIRHTRFILGTRQAGRNFSFTTIIIILIVVWKTFAIISSWSRSRSRSSSIGTRGILHTFQTVLARLICQFTFQTGFVGGVQIVIWMTCTQLLDMVTNSSFYTHIYVGDIQQAMSSNFYTFLASFFHGVNKVVVVTLTNTLVATLCIFNARTVATIMKWWYPNYIAKCSGETRSACAGNETGSTIAMTSVTKIDGTRVYNAVPCVACQSSSTGRISSKTISTNVMLA